MQQKAKNLSDALNQALDELEAPENIRERSIILSKMLPITKQQAWALLEGHTIPDDDILALISSELEIDVAALGLGTIKK